MKFMKAVEFNVWMSIIKLIADHMNDSSISKYNIAITGNDVKPSFPRDLTKFKKPSIIIQKVDTIQSSLCFGGFAGQYHDIDADTYVDTVGTKHLSTFQIDVFGDTNTQCSLLTSIVCEDILGTMNTIPIYDFTSNFSNPTLMGYGTLLNDIEITNLDSNDNNDYRNAIRLDINVVQVAAPEQDIIDLSRIRIRYRFTI